MVLPSDEPIDLAGPPRPGDRWFVVQTRSRQELILADELRAMGIHFCLPVVTRPRKFGSHEADVAVPLFPGHLFRRGSEHDADLAVRTDRVAGVTEVPDASRLDRELSSLCRAIEAGAGGRLDPCAARKVGSYATVCTGPLCGVEGFVETSGDGTARVILQLTCIDRAVAMRVDAATIAIAD